MSLTTSNSGFDPTNFIGKANTDGCKLVAWTSEEKGNVFTLAVRGSLGESIIVFKSRPLVSIASKHYI